MRVLIPVPPAHSAVGWLSATGAIGHTAGLMADLDKYEERSQKAADSLRTLLATLASAGNGLVYAARAHTDSRTLWLLAAVAFAAALACTIRSWFTVKARTIRRRDAAADGRQVPKFKQWSPRSSWLWDTLSSFALVLGLAFLALAVALYPRP